MTADLLLGFVMGVPFGMLFAFIFSIATAKVHPAITDAEVRQRIDSAKKCVDLAGQHLSIVLYRESSRKEEP